jgi:hypothetical protein
VEELEDRAEVATPERSQPITIQIVEANTVELDAAGFGAIHATEEIEQGCFSGSGGASQSNPLACLDAQ